MAITLTATEKKILQQVTIPPRPEVLIKVSEEAKKPEPDVSVIADIIASDVSISAAVLQVVNSAAFARRSEIKSIPQAVMTLGFKRLFPLVKAVALKSAMSKGNELAEIWDIGSNVATACAQVATAVGKPALADNAYMLGLFHVAGIPLLMLHFDDYEEVWQFGKEQGWDQMNERELNQYDTSHSTVGALLAQKWFLPKALVEIIYYSQDVEGLYESNELSSVALDLLSILKIARRAESITNQSFQSQSEWEAAVDPLIAHLAIDESQVDAVIENTIELLQNN